MFLFQHYKVVSKCSTLSVPFLFGNIKYCPPVPFLTILFVPLLATYSTLIYLSRSTLFMGSNRHSEPQLHVFNRSQHANYQQHSPAPSHSVSPLLSFNIESQRNSTLNCSRLETVFYAGDSLYPSSFLHVSKLPLGPSMWKGILILFRTPTVMQNYFPPRSHPKRAMMTLQV